MVKKGILLFLVLMLTGCTLTRKEKYPDFKVQFFYRDFCGYCEAFKEYAMPALEKEFKEAIHIEYYNMDDEEAMKMYNDICDQLYFYDENYRGDAPFFVMEGQFAVLGYQSGEEKELIKDIKHALNGEELGSKLSAYRWEFRL